MPLVSIIVPIYNAERYLERSINSLINQTLEDIEIILINDGSIDNSFNICKEYEKINHNIKVIDKENGGVSDARNIGIKHATGKYIGFMDPDDWIEKNMYKNLYQKIKDKNSKVAMCNYIIKNNKNEVKIDIPTDKEVFEKDDIIQWLIPNMIGTNNLDSNQDTIMGSVWRLLVDREVIIQNNIWFPTEVVLMEDLLWCLQLFLNIDKIALDTNAYYYYMVNKNSALTSYREDMYYIQKEVYNKVESLIKLYRVEKFVFRHLQMRYGRMMIGCISNEVNGTSSKTRKEVVRNINKFCNDINLQSILEKIDTKGYSLKRRLVIWAIRNKVWIILYLYYKGLEIIRG